MSTAPTPMGRWTGGTHWSPPEYQRFHVYAFQFPRLQTGKLGHKIEDVITIEVIKCPEGAFIYAPGTGRWYQHERFKHGMGGGGPGQWAVRFNQIPPGKVPVEIQAHCLLASVL
jgi:hypothetical protein